MRGGGMVRGRPRVDYIEVITIAITITAWLRLRLHLKFSDYDYDYDYIEMITIMITCIWYLSFKKLNTSLIMMTTIHMYDQYFFVNLINSEK